MNLYLYPVEYKRGNCWDETMVQNWIESKLSFLTFSFNRFFPKYLPEEPFWLYLYYCKRSTNNKDLKGKLRFRFSVVNWDHTPYRTTDTYFFPSKEESTVWFLINRFEEVQNDNGELLKYEDFVHTEGKVLGSCLRNSIASAICTCTVNIVRSYPNF